MKCHRFLTVFNFCVMVYSACVGAQTAFEPTSAPNAHWMFMGTVSSEGGETYGYYFNLDKKGNTLHVMTSLIEKSSQKMVFFEDETSTDEVTQDHHFKVGDTFLQFNPVNNSWVLGLKHKNKSGFNLKIDMLKPDEANPQGVKHPVGFSHYIAKTSQANGHIKLNEEVKEQFVTANQAWFFQSYIDKNDKIDLNRFFCALDSGAGFYLIKTQNIQTPVLKGWYTAEDKPISMSSQLGLKKLGADTWHLDLRSPSVHYELKDYLHADSVMLGFIQKGGQGFCLQSKAEL